MKLICSFALAAMIALLTTAAAHAQAVEEVYPIDVTIAQNQPLEIIRPNVFDLTHPKLLKLTGSLAGPEPGTLGIFFDWIDAAGVKQTSPVVEFPFTPGGVNAVDMQYVIPFCPPEVSVDFRLATAPVVRFVGEFTHICLVPEPAAATLAMLAGCGLIAAARRRAPA